MGYHGAIAAAAALLARATGADRAAVDMLLHFALPPVTRLHRAAALRNTQGPRAALAEVDGLAAELDRYYLFHATRAGLRRALGHPDEARAADRLALELTANPAEHGPAPGTRRVLSDRCRPPGGNQAGPPRR
ncbi:hypothetical protein [Streptomyces sp. TRM68367]|uniref:hypothetical protein n=1 Tax=Streptomyces sp. TRM68367 TaxID=2758415 RepID=UPI00165CB553|nr:hypothetical protein [Streptomyces sp. TRM68367]MBC9724770.1 hypothetical protein [Streptomyces sp. TRM68367]